MDEDVKRYCEQVCAAGMVEYKVMMKEWKCNKRHRGVLLESHPSSQMIAEMVRPESLMAQAPEEINTSIIQGETNNLKDMLCIKEARDTSRSEEAASKALCEEVHVQNMTHCHDPMWRSEETLPKALCEEARVQDMAAQSCHEAVTPNPVLSNTRARSRTMEDSQYEPNRNAAVTSNTGAMPMEESNEASPSQYDPNHNEALAQAQDDSSPRPQSVALVDLSNEEILDMWYAQ